MDDIYVAAEPAAQLKNVHSRVRNIEVMIKRMAEHQHLAGDYTVADFAKLVDRRPYTVREWCRLGRITARKVTGAKRGDEEEWRIPRSEYERYKNDGLLPLQQRN